MSITPRFLDELRERLTLSEIIGRRVKLTPRGREFTGLCPFHHEKTGSFTVNDDKGFYHCFGCGAHGDVIKFVVESEKMPFTEAVEYLANIAGLQVPKSSPKQEALDKKNASLLEIMETACQFFQEHLFGTAGTGARNYLIGRGISGNVAKQFRLGYAPAGSTLTARLQAKGYNIEDCIALGLVARNRERNTVHDYFYDRVMFPILDRRRRVIGFGGRIMTKGEPKYLNSPETVLFHKGEQLYALPNAIDTVRKKNEAILVEGYMDVIALHSAGFTNAVAPLGTALTENQIGLLWKMCDEPIICFDGDSAGRRAATRAMNRALPILTPGKSLRFIWLPDPFDPDDMIRKKSPEAFNQMVKTAKPMTFALWNALLEGRSLDTPERLAKLKQDGIDTINGIKNETVRDYYLKDFNRKLWQLDRKKKETTLPFQNSVAIMAPTPATMEAKMLIAYLLCYPQITQKVLEDIIGVVGRDAVLNSAIQTISEPIMENPDISSEELLQIIPKDVLKIFTQEIEMLKKSNRSERRVNDELLRWIQTARIQAIENDIQEKIREFDAHPSEEIWAQISTLKKEKENLQESV